jgi:signal transduction histidine kinase/CheY-like chemotaxis protein
MKELRSLRFWGLGEDPASRVLRRECAELTGHVALILLALDLAVLLAMSLTAGVQHGILLASTGVLAAFLVVSLLLVRAHRPRAGAWVMCVGLLSASLVSVMSAKVVDVGPAVSLLTLIAVAAITLGPMGTVVFGTICGFSVLAVTCCLGGAEPESVPLRSAPWATATGVFMSAVALAVLLMMMFLVRLRSMDRELTAAEERDAARIAFLQAQKLEALGRLAGGIAHDFNNLLGVVRGASDVLRLRGRDPAIAGRMLDDLDSAVERATLMAERLLSYSRNRINGTHAADIAALASSLVPLLGRLVGGRIEVILVGAEKPLWAKIEPTEFEQVLMNLAVNARDAMPRGGLFRVILSEDDDQTVLVTVEDTGPGIPPEIRREVFSPFFSTKRDGTGLGLATVRDIIEGAKGRIELASQMDEGTTFRIYLARASAHEMPVRSSEPIRLPPSPGRVLLVEDHDLARRSMAQLLHSAGFEVIPVAHGLEALGVLDAGLHPDLVVTDNVMPKMDGLQLCVEARRRGVTCPILMVSGDAPPVRQGNEPFPDAFLPKPFKMADLLHILSVVPEPAKSALGERGGLRPVVEIAAPSERPAKSAAARS